MCVYIRIWTYMYVCMALYRSVPLVFVLSCLFKEDTLQKFLYIVNRSDRSPVQLTVYNARMRSFRSKKIRSQKRERKQRREKKKTRRKIDFDDLRDATAEREERPARLLLRDSWDRLRSLSLWAFSPPLLRVFLLFLSSPSVFVCFISQFIWTRRRVGCLWHV